MQANESAVSQIAKNQTVEEISRNLRVDSEYFDDLVQEVYFILITGYTEEVLSEAIKKKQEKFIITKILKNLWLSKTSPFYRQYKKPKLLKTHIEEYKEEPNETE